MIGHTPAAAPPRATRIVALAPGIALSACHTAMLSPAGPVARGQSELLTTAFGAMLIIIVPVILAALGFAWWYRAGNRRAVYAGNWSYSGRIELITWAVSLLMIAFLGTLAWASSHDLDPYKPLASRQKPIRVQVVALDWKWLFIYPDLGVASVNALEMPVGTPVEFHLTSASVMNSMLIPRLGGQIYAMSGMETRLALQADKPGQYPGLAASISGDGFSDMHFVATAAPAPAFAQWLTRARATPARLTDTAYVALAKPSEAIAPALYGGVAPGLFGRILAQSPALAAPAGIKIDGSPITPNDRGSHAR